MEDRDFNITEQEIEEAEKETKEIEKMELDVPDTVSSFQQYMREIRNCKVLSQEELVKLFSDMHNGDESAREKIILANLRLPIAVAKRYYTMSDFEDIVSEGNLWLMNAVDKYDETKNINFSTYAYVSIKRGIARYMVERLGMGLPVGANQTALLVLKTAYENIINEQKRVPSFEELQKETGLSKDMVMSLVPIACGNLSLDDKAYRKSNEESEVATLGETLEQTIYPTPEKCIEELDLKERIAEALKRLEEDEQLAIIYTFGLDGQTPMTFTEISQIYGKSRQRWQQIQRKGLKKLKVIAKKMGLQVYI